MRPNIQWTVQVSIKEGQLEAAKALAAEMTTATKQEEGALQFEWFFSEDGSICHILEEYRDSDAAIVHMHNFLDNFVQKFLECFDPTGIYVYGSASDGLKEVMSPFGPAHLTFDAGFIRVS